MSPDCDHVDEEGRQRGRGRADERGERRRAAGCGRGGGGRARTRRWRGRRRAAGRRRHAGGGEGEEGQQEDRGSRALGMRGHRDARDAKTVTDADRRDPRVSRRRRPRSRPASGPGAGTPRRGRGPRPRWRPGRGRRAWPRNRPGRRRAGPRRRVVPSAGNVATPTDALTGPPSAETATRARSATWAAPGGVRVRQQEGELVAAVAEHEVAVAAGAARARRAILRRSSSPAWWPIRLFTSRKSSRSSMIRPNGAPVADGLLQLLLERAVVEQAGEVVRPGADLDRPEHLRVLEGDRDLRGEQLDEVELLARERVADAEPLDGQDADRAVSGRAAARRSGCRPRVASSSRKWLTRSSWRSSAM